MTIRQLNSTLRDSLLEGDAFAYAHLVKFEKPLVTDGGKSARRASDYTYITDGSQEIVFDDGSKDVSGNSNGPQTYLPGKLTGVGEVSETTQAKVSNMTLKLSAAALNTSLVTTITINSSSLTVSSSTADLVEAGFREGDLVQLLGSGNNNELKVRLNSFSNANRTASITPMEAVTNESGATYGINFASSEVSGILNTRADTGYAGYINRDVFVYKAHLNVETGLIIGAPYLLFKGIISTGKLSEDVTSKSEVSWGLTSHWGDFNRVSGRLTRDASHRALDANNVPDPESVHRPAYATDLGFLHSEQAINLVSTYQVQETRTKIKHKKGFLGFGSSIKQTEYEVSVDREVDLRFNLDSKYLPVLYGVNKIDSIPIFVDTLATDSRQIFVAYAISEGEIGGIYDIYLDDTNSVCLDANDSATRTPSAGNANNDDNAIDVVCYGRMDRGDTLSSKSRTSGTFTGFGHTGGRGYSEWLGIGEESGFAQYDIGTPIVNFNLGGASTQGAGITHEKATHFDIPINASITIHTGKSDQRADAVLVQNASNFKVGQDYYTGSSDYWGASHQLLDTAYAVANYTIGEGETTIPSLEFVVRGRGIRCYNYDYSYEQYPSYESSDTALTSWNIGESVTIKRTSNDAVLSSTTIADKYQITNMDGTTSTRVRLADNPVGTTEETSFYMQSGSKVYHFAATGHVANSGTVPELLQTVVASAAAASDNNSATVVLTPGTAAFNAAMAAGRLISFTSSNIFSKDWLDSFVYTFTASTNTVTGLGNTGSGASNLATQYITVKDGIALASNASSVSDSYNDLFIELTSVKADNSVKVQRRTILDYDGTTKVATVSTPWDEDSIPKASDTYKIFFREDVRVSINPAMQFLDYATNTRFGAALEIGEDLNLESFLDSARKCDTRSDVTMLLTAAPTVGQVYKYATSGGKTLWQGTVESVVSVSAGGTKYSTTFTNVVGKLGLRWEDWKTIYTGEFYYYKGALHQASSDGIPSTPSTTSSMGSFNLTKVSSGAGPTTVGVDVDSTRNHDDNPIVKKFRTATTFDSGYELYDSCSVKYWRYMGWESQNQREVTRHQTNAIIDTKNPVFSNINSMLNHFNGLIRYSNGQYFLDVKSAASPATSVTVSGTTYEVEKITEDHIIGNIDVEDAGQKGTFNHVDVSLKDPQNLFESRSVVLFDSTYLKQDRMVPKKGSVKSPSISNYYNARINAKQYLEQSRAGLKVNFTLGPWAILLVAGDVIQLSYSRFGWSNKLFRITNLRFKNNCLVQVTAEEHEDGAFIVQPTNGGIIVPVDGTSANVPAPVAPNSLTATQNSRGGIELNWTNPSNFNPSVYTVQIWRSATNNRAVAELIGTSKSGVYIDTVIEGGSTTKYYWIRYTVLTTSQRTSGVAPREVFSAYHPTSATAGVSGISDGARDALLFTLSNDNVTVPANSSGAPTSLANTSTTIQVFAGSTPLTYDDSSPYANSSFRVSSVAVTGVPGNSSVTTTSNSYQLGDITSMTGSIGTRTFTIVATDSLGATTTITKVQTLTKANSGLVGVDSRAVNLTVGDQVFSYSDAGITPSPTSTTVTATKLNSPGTAYFNFIKNGTSVQHTTSNTYTYSPQANVSNMPDTIKVELREGSTAQSVLATDQITLSGIRPGVDAFAVILTNESHALPTTSGGSVTFTGSGTDVLVYKGLTQLNSVSGTPGAGQFQVSRSGSGITPGAVSVVGNSAQIANHSNMTATQATVTITINIENTATFTRVQSLTKSIAGADGTSITGPTGPRTVTGYVYYQLSSTGNPGTPVLSGYNYSTGVFSSKTSNWGEDAPEFVAGNSNKYWYSSYVVTESSFGGTQTVTEAIAKLGIGFSGLVTFQADGDIDDGTNTYNPAARVNAGVTTINGGKITADSISAAQLQISASSSTNSSMFFDGTNNRIDIKDSNGTLRVRIGNLS